MFEIRAEANVNVQNWAAALKDAQAMTAIDPKKSKGYLLQAKILRILQKYVAEVEIYQHGLQAVDPKEDKKYGLLEQGLHDAKKISKSILNDPKMMELFVLFDKDKKSSVDFKDVAIGLYQLTNDMHDAQRQAAALLLMMDEDDQRTLIYEKFAKLIMAMTAISGIGFKVMYDQLKEALEQNKPVPEEFLNEIRVTQQDLHATRDKMQKKENVKKTLDALSYSRTSKLFDQWDTDDSGTIDFQELLVGLRKYQRAVMKNSFNANKSNVATNASMMADVEKNALMVMGHDNDSNQELDKEEFAIAMTDYAEIINVDLHELIDFMCAVASQPESQVDMVSEYESMYSDVTPSSYESWTMQKKQTSAHGGLGTIVDMCEEDEEEEEEDW
jgi:Ca2+-binding EF-hand superfamily protein